MAGNIMATVDVETTGTVFGYNEIIQVAIVPLDHQLNPSKEHKFFYRNIAPLYPERQTKGAKMKHGLDAHKMAQECQSQDQVAQDLDDWFLKMDLPLGRRLVPIAHNWAFERGFLTHWLGLDLFDTIFHIHPRDTMTFAAAVNDVYAWQGMAPPFSKLSLTGMCERVGVPLDNAHDALADCIATARLYREMLRSFG